MEDPTTVPESALDDRTLLALLQQRVPAGLALLYDRYGRIVYGLALRMLGDVGAAEEVTQDVFLRCWQHIDRYQPAQGTLAAWLLAIAHHRAIDELRSRRQRQRRHEQGDEELATLATRDPALDELLLRDEVRRGLSQLPDAQREAIELIFWGGLTRREAAARLGVPLGTLHTRLRLGMERLRQSFARLFDEA
ncbi:sigma-70 family RNA polymerase sigma factor [Kallotenue papyrolyticum]|uniref:sigma-70 family RNA polymerase sigma factor n=1 Tax=Kallotenue papyrolyticum TaxID=1325125 RepID=UPI000478677F|nr:sigma-70 family RNA polymerase sigma factor [Kallotenue papyrolyticum]